MFYIRHACTLNNKESLACISTVTMDLGLMVPTGGPVTFTPVVKHLSVELSLPVLSTVAKKI